MYEIVSHIMNSLTGILPIILVSVGCVVIGVHVKILSLKRLSFSQQNSHRWSKNATSKTTKILFTVCILFIICSGFSFLLPYLNDLEILKNECGVKNILLFMHNFSLVMNSFGNFIIYVGVNKHFRILCKALFHDSKIRRQLLFKEQTKFNELK